MLRKNRLFSLLGGLVVLAGCGGPSGEPESVVNSAVPVSGRVLLSNGQPLANVWVVFHAKDAPGNDASAATEADGSFKLGTFKKDDGAIPGHYEVTIERHPNVKTPDRIPKAYKSTQTTPLKVEIKPTAGNELQPFKVH